jgi:catechol 2,3-dioxygenase-like lactoylglutathione lyase family enzyme
MAHPAHRLLALLVVCAACSLGTAAPAAERPTPATATAGNALFYYADLDAAERFYREQLGLVPVAVHDHARILQIAPGAFLTLADAAAAGYAADSPRTAAIALVTDQLDGWWSALKDRGLTLRSSFDPTPGRPHDGFVLVDPEGYFLEFERFNAHPENRELMPRLAASPTRFVDAAAAGLPEGLGFKATILWFYYADLAEAEAFTTDTLGLPLITDQGWAKIHPIAPAAYFGLVDATRGMHGFTEEKAVALTLLDPRLDAWSAWLVAEGQAVLHQAPSPARPRAEIEIRDPGNYRIQWRAPEANETAAAAADR